MGGTVVTTVTSQQEDSRLEFQLQTVCAYVLPASEFSPATLRVGLFPKSKDMLV